MIPAQQIRELCFPASANARKLIDPFDSTRLGSYYYNLTVERVVVPGRSPTIHDLTPIRPNFTIEPGRIVWLRMAERISTPSDTIASLEQTHHFTRMGLTFINLSLVFPNYRGYLTCAVANFSSGEISIDRSDNVARLTFSKLEKSHYPQREILYESKEKYDSDLVREARNSDDTFFGLSTVESKIRQSIMQDLQSFASKVLWRYTFVGAGLIIFFTALPVLQGMFTKWAYQDNIVTKSELRDALQLLETMRSFDKLDQRNAQPKE